MKGGGWWDQGDSSGATGTFVGQKSFLKDSSCCCRISHMSSERWELQGQQNQVTFYRTWRSVSEFTATAHQGFVLKRGFQHEAELCMTGSFSRIMLSLWCSARFFRRVWCCWGLGRPNLWVHPQPVLWCCVTLSSIRGTLLQQLNGPLTRGDVWNIPNYSFFLLLILLPFSPFPSSSAFYGIHLFLFHLALIQLQQMKFIPKCEFPLEVLF